MDRQESAMASARSRRGGTSHSATATATSTDTNTSASPDAEKAARLQKQIAGMETQLAETQAKLSDARAELKNPSVEATVRKHIALLHQYNEIRDVGIGLFELIAESRGVRVREVYAEYDMDEKD